MKTILLIFSFLFITNCKSQKYNRISLPKIDNSTETYNNNLADSILIKLNNKNKKLASDKQYHIGRHTKTNSISFSIYDSVNEREVVNYSYTGEFISGRDYSANPVFGVFKQYYSNTMKLKTKGIICIYGFKVGRWYNYDDQGNLISVENTDKEYNFTHENIIKYCDKNNIPLDPYDPSISARIHKIIFKEQHIWVISYDDYTSGYSKSIQISGKNGSVIGVFNNGKIPVN